jgi:hypothetical protein
MVKCKRRTTKRKPNSEGSVGSRGKRGRGWEGREKKKKVNNLWVYEKQRVPYDCTFLNAVFKSHKCYPVAKYRTRTQAQIHEPQSWSIINTHCLKTKPRILSFKTEGHESTAVLTLLSQMKFLSSPPGLETVEM